MESVQRSTYLYLADGRLFIRRDHGEIDEADTSERDYAASLLAVEVMGRLDPIRGFELLPPSES